MAGSETAGRLGLAGLAILLSGCLVPGPKFNPYNGAISDLSEVTKTNTVDPSWLKPPTEMFTLGPGDRVDIELLGDPTSRTQATVGPDGKIYFHLLPGQDVWGLTLGETKALLERELANYIKDQVTVTVNLRGVESKRFWLLGRVAAPGVYTMPTQIILTTG